jgi:predicted metalloprotease with PDZ domain
MPRAPTRYRIAAVDPRAHLFEVSCIVDEPDRDGQRFRLPAWIPGSYLIREFARHFVDVRAHSDGRPIAIAKEAKDVWRAARCQGPLGVTATVYAYDLSVRAAYLDRTRGFFNGTSVFLCPEGREDHPCEVDIVEAMDTESPWRVATTLPRAGAPPYGFGAYRAASYDELIDHPVEMADFSLASFTAGGAAHDIAISGRHRGDIDRLARDLARVCQWQCDLFAGAADGRAPFDRYLFLVNVVGDGHGGLEHRASTSLVCKRSELPQPGSTAVDNDYRNLLGLASHEYFHSWNVKRIKPAAFVPYDLARENYTRQLWAFEGFTSYYDDLSLVRSGVISANSYLELVGRTLTNVLRTPGRERQSVADSSYDAWIKYYRQDENTPNAIVSYYAKGAVIGLALDLTLRRHGRSLDDVMRALWQRYGQTALGVPEGGVAALASEIAGAGLDDFFASYVDDTEDPPIAQLLRDVGVSLHRRAAEGASDRGGSPGKDGKRPRCWIGAKFAPGAEAKLEHVFTGGPAHEAGLAANDVIVAVDGIKASAESIERIATTRAAGDALAMHAFRRDELLTTRLTLAPAPHDTAWLTLDAECSGAALAARASWLGVSASDATA